MATLMQKTTGGWALYDGNGVKLLELNNGKIVLKQSISCIGTNGNRVSSNDLNTILQNLANGIDWLDDWTCLKAGTQILMMDGTTKNIEDIKYGDYVKSWDPLTSSYVNAKCYGSICTGHTHVWQLHVFDNGSIVEIRQNHPMFLQREGVLRGSSKWNIGDKGLGLDGVDRVLVKRFPQHDSTEARSFNLLTENGMYFANGILVGHVSNDKWLAYQHTPAYFPNITEEEIEFFRATGELFDNSSRREVDTREYLAEAAPVFGYINIAKKKINDYKANLAKNDYKTIKYIQGDLSEEEFHVHAAEAKALRTKIEEQEAIVVLYNSQLNDLREKYNITEETRFDRYHQAYAIDIEHTRNNGYN